MLRQRLLGCLALAAGACCRPAPHTEATPSISAADAGRDDAPTAPPAGAIPWQPHGLRRPTLHCDLDVPAGWTRSASPMPDHLAELSTNGRPSHALPTVML